MLLHTSDVILHFILPTSSFRRHPSSFILPPSLHTSYFILPTSLGLYYVHCNNYGLVGHGMQQLLHLFTDIRLVLLGAMIVSILNLMCWVALARYDQRLSLPGRPHTLRAIPLFVMPYWQAIQRFIHWGMHHPVGFYSLIMVGWFAPLLYNHQVILPYRPFIYANLEPIKQSSYTESTFFGDYLTGFIPQITLHLHAPRSGWLSLWSNQLEFGHQLLHLSGFSPAYVLTWVMSWVIDDAYVLSTVSFVICVYLTGLFALLYAQLITSHRQVALLAGLVFAFTLNFYFYNTFVMFAAICCWGVALCYGLLRLRYEPHNRWVALFISFAIYSLLYTAYPQSILTAAYIIAGYMAVLAWQLRQQPLQFRAFIGWGIGALVCGVALTLPAYLDIYTGMQLSAARSAIGLDFFLASIPNVQSLQHALEIGLAYVVSDIWQPITTFTKTKYPFNGGHTSLLMLLLMLLGAQQYWRNVWGWVVWLLIAIAFSFNHTLFQLGYASIFPQVSRGVLFGGFTQYFPQFVLALYGIHGILTTQWAHRPRQSAISLFVAGQCIIGAVAYAYWQHIPVQWNYVGYEFAVVAGMVVVLRVTQPSIKFGLLVLMILINTQLLVRPLLLVQPYANVIHTSDTAQTIQKTLSPDSYVAVVAIKPSVRLEPNFTVMLDIPIIGAYSSLQSRYYVALMRRLHVDYHTYTRNIRSIGLPLNYTDLWLSNVRTIVSDKPIDTPGITRYTRSLGMYIYTIADGMGCCLRVPASALRTASTTPNQYWIDNPQATTNQRLTKKEDHGDAFQLVFPAQAEDSVIIFNQQFHPDWIAEVQTPQGWQPTTTVVINEVYQGVQIPVGSTALSLQFQPWVRWSLVANLFWLLLGSIWIYRKIMHMHHTRATIL